MSAEASCASRGATRPSGRRSPTISRGGRHHPRLRDDDLELARQLLAPAGISLEQLRERGWMRAADFPQGTAPFADGGFPTPSGKVELYSPALAAQGHDPVVGYAPPYETIDGELAERYPLVLLATAGRFFTNATFGTSDWHLGKMGPPRIHLHPVDAERRGIASHDEVRVFNDRGALTAEAVIDDATRPGVAFTHKSYWPKRSRDGLNVNAMTAERDSDRGGAPTFHDNRVEVALAGSSSGTVDTKRTASRLAGVS